MDIRNILESYKNFVAFKQAQLDSNFPPIFAIPEFPEEALIGSGHSGQVHKVVQNDRFLALKLESRMHSIVRAGQLLTLKKDKEDRIAVSPLPDRYYN